MNKNIFKQQHKRNQIEEGLYKYFMAREEFGSKVNTVGNPSDKFLSPCDKLRGSIEPAEYKHVVLGLIFLKFASDKFEQRKKELIEIHKHDQ
jgi:hypothetical protein